MRLIIQICYFGAVWLKEKPSLVLIVLYTYYVRYIALYSDNIYYFQNVALVCNFNIINVYHFYTVVTSENPLRVKFIIKKISMNN